MKEKMSLFIALSFLLCLTVYKKSITNNTEILENSLIETSEILENSETNIITENNNIYDEVNEQCLKGEQNTDQLSFNDAFKYYRDCNNDIFKWNGLEYTTLLKKDVNDNVNENPEKVNTKLDLVSN